MSHACAADLTALNTFGFESQAAKLSVCESTDDVERCVADADEAGLPILVLGEGSNVVLGRSLNRWVLALDNEGISRRDNGDCVSVTVGAGHKWHDFVEKMVDEALCGAENLALIPGKVGAAPVQNIGAYGVELKDIFESLLAYDMLEKQWRTFSVADCEFGYRNSCFKSQFVGRYVIYSVTFKLSKTFTPKLGYAGLGDIDTSLGPRGVFDRVVQVRSEKLPDPRVVGNAGSFFENPIVSEQDYQALLISHPNLVAFQDKPGFMKLAAGWLIDQAGWKGRSHKSVGVYQKQALVLVNRGGGSAIELTELSAQIADSVYQKFGVRLRQEPRNYLD